VLHCHKNGILPDQLNITNKWSKHANVKFLEFAIERSNVMPQSASINENYSIVSVFWQY